MLKELGKGAIELIANRRVDMIEPDECELLDLLPAESGRPVTWLVLRKFIHQPESYKEVLRVADAQIRRGARRQLATIPLVTELSLRQPPISFAPYPSWKNAFNTTPDNLKALYSNQAFRQKLKGSGSSFGAWNLVTVNLAKTPEARAFVGKTVEEVAQLRGKDGLDTFFDLVSEDDLELRYTMIRTEVPAELLDDPRVLIGESDAGAHVDQFCTAGYSTDMIGTWVRDKQVLSLERAIARMTSEPADFFGIHDRGRLRPGTAADIAIFNYDEVGACDPQVVYDLSGGGRRMIMKSRGMEYVVVNGRVIFEGNNFSGETPGAYCVHEWRTADARLVSLLNYHTNPKTWSNKRTGTSFTQLSIDWSEIRSNSHSAVNECG